MEKPTKQQVLIKAITWTIGVHTDSDTDEALETVETPEVVLCEDNSVLSSVVVEAGVEPIIVVLP